MTLLELQDVLGERIKAVTNKDLTPEERQIEYDTSAMVASLAKQMVNVADVVLRSEKLYSQSHKLETYHSYSMIVGGENES